MTPEGLAQLKTDEGLRLQPYTDTKGSLSIGYGRNLTANGITEAEASGMLQDDVEAVTEKLSAFSWFKAVSPVRQDVLINMAHSAPIQ
jgi:lysozyme